MRFYTVTQLGKHTALTPEGYLVAEGVPVARCGQQIYHHSELPLEPNQDGFVSVNRDPTEVFRAESVKSFQGKPIVNDHPMDEVGPGNWNNLAIGVMINPRRGTGADDDVLLADLLFTTPAGIQLVQSGKRAVSVGYDAHYDQIAPGMGSQKNIVCNHLALVDVARCGPRCTIMDSGGAVYNDAWDASQPVVGAHAHGCGCAACDAPTARRMAWLDSIAADTEDIDWPDNANIDWADDFVEAEHPREPKGSEGGGQFTSGATSVSISTTTGATTTIHQPSDYLKWMSEQVPEPGKKWIGIRNSVKQMRAHTVKALAEGHSAESVIQRLKEIAHTEVHGSVAAYANDLIKHVERAHQLTAGMYGTATNRPELRKKKEQAAPIPEPAPPPTPDPEERLRQRRRDYAQTVPDAPLEWIARRASVRQMKALAIRALETDEPPIEVVKQIQAMAGRELHGKVSAYANTLIDHIAEAWATDFSAYRATPRKADTTTTPAPQPTPTPQPKPPPPKPQPVKKLPTHISEVMAERSKYWGERERNFHGAAWKHASPQILAAMMTMRPLAGKGGGVDAVQNKGCHYDPGDHHIQMSADTMSTWRHEYGHAIDWNAAGWGIGEKYKFNNQSYRADKDRAAESYKLVQAVRAGTKSDINAYEWEEAATEVGVDPEMLRDFTGSLKSRMAVIELLKGNIAWAPIVEKGVTGGTMEGEGWRERGRANSEWQDFLGSMTHELVGNGHGKSYYTKMQGYQTAEMFAQYVALTNNENGELYRKLLHKVAPQCCAHFDDILAERAGLKDGPANPNDPAIERVDVTAPHMQRAA